MQSIGFWWSKGSLLLLKSEKSNEWVWVYFLRTKIKFLWREFECIWSFQNLITPNKLFFASKLEDWQKLFLKWIKEFFWNSCTIICISNQLFWTKKLRGCVTLKRFSRQNFFKKWTFFKFFCIFEISLMSWFEKWSYFLILKKIWSQTSKNPTFEANRSLVIAFRIIVNIFLCILKVFEVFSTDL